ncbi:MAG: polymer-forming cytoskeletal protein [Deltaproteobacteria bacterium]|nr:polymer-forming cytoskeletal protein [Deltaproteobacteria bacterium]
MAAKEPCHIGSSVTVTGQVSGNQDLVVEGRIEGRVGLDSRLVVESGGAVEAEIEATEAEIHGAVKGDMTVKKTVTLHQSARVMGNIRAAQFVLAEGAQFTGNIEMDVELPPDVVVGA